MVREVLKSPRRCWRRGSSSRLASSKASASTNSRSRERSTRLLRG